MSRGSIFLRNLVDREVGDVDVGAQLGFKRSADIAQLIPNNPAEEGVGLDLGGTAMSTTLATDTVLSITKEATKTISNKLDQDKT